MENVTVPGWAWGALLGAILWVVIKRVAESVMDVILVKQAGKSATAADPRREQVDTCTQTCKIQWEAHVATAISSSQATVCAKLDAGFDRVHERIDELFGKGKQ